jgi:outer membrane immunogenic protein
MLRDKILAALAVAILATGYCHDARADGLPKSGVLPIGEVAKAGASSWTGFYVGAHGGYGWGEWNGDFHWQDVDLGHGYQLNHEGWLYGLQAGVNYQIGRMVLGVEADVTWGDMEKSGQFQANDAIDAGSYVEWEIRQKLERFGTARLRVGYLPTQKFMMYATGGLAWGQTSASQTIHYPKYDPPFVNGVGSVEETHLGWAAGGGVEWMLLPNVTLRAEYLYLNFGRESYHFVGNSGKNLDKFYADDRAPSDLDFHVIRGGLNFKF